MNLQYTYVLILAVSIAGPLLLSFDKKVAYYRKWKYLFPALLFPALFFLVWDELKTRAGVWSFNDAYIIGVKLFSLPLEEVLFFLVVPFCCVFIYECIISYFPDVRNKKWGDRLLLLLGACFLIAAALTYGIKPEMAHSLHNRAEKSGLSELWMVDKAKHNQAMHIAGDEYHRKLVEFFDEHLGNVAEPKSKTNLMANRSPVRSKINV